jgi:hypothetical protein
MFMRYMTLAGLAGILGATVLAGTAQADHGFRLRFVQPPVYGYYPPQYDPYYDPYYEEDFYYEPRPRVKRRYLKRERQYGNFDPRYDEYEDRPYVPPKKKKKAAKAKPAVKPETKKSTALAPKPETKKSTALAPNSDTKQSAALVPQKPAAAKAQGSSMSCDKAAEIITGYGFSTVTPKTCEGQSYAFNATRSGKSYAIKLNPANGELTDVQKLP